jgi:cyclic pyranopterin phosphate synthase
VDLALTTNGTQLHRYLDTIKECGIKSLNISLDTLQKDRFLLMTRRDQFDLVWQNIHLALQHDLTIKVNMVVMKGINEEEIIDFVEWTKELPIHVRFIEFMPFDGNRWNSNRVVTMQQMLDRINEKYQVNILQNKPHETAKNFQVDGYKGSFAIISTMSAPFCGDCNRMRLTADGKMKNCLFSESETDLLTAFRNGENITTLIHQNIKEKKQALGGQFTTELDKIETANLHNRSMISIGG